MKKNDINITKQKIQEKQEKRLNAGWEDVRIDTRTFVRKICGDYPRQPKEKTYEKQSIRIPYISQ